MFRKLWGFMTDKQLVQELQGIRHELFHIRQEQFEIKEKLKAIMATQEEFNAQIAAANEKLDAIGTDVTNIGTSITAETQQILDFLATLPAGIDTSAMDGVVTRLGAAADSLSGTADSISGIFTPPVPAPTEG
jgi:ABC-type transporter Mla subunit MlaD